MTLDGRSSLDPFAGRFCRRFKVYRHFGDQALVDLADGICNPQKFRKSALLMEEYSDESIMCAQLLIMRRIHAYTE